MVKIKDIALTAGVSSATVSRILRNDPLLSVRGDTRMEVLRIADELGYQRKVKKVNKNRYVGIIQWISRFEEEEDPYYYELRKSVESQLNQRGFEVHRYYKEDIETVFKDGKLSGLICVGKFSMKQARRFKDYINHIIFVDSNPDGEMFSSVVFDFETATETAMNHLISLGHRRIGFIGGREYIGPERQAYVDKRERTFIDFMKNHPETEYCEDDVYIHDFTAETGFQSIRKALAKDTRPSAFFCESDTIAMGALRALGESDRLDGKMISVVGCNDILSAQYMNPALTTVKLDTRYMSEVAVMLLENMIECHNAVPLKASLSTKLVVRDSTAPK